MKKLVSGVLALAMCLPIVGQVSSAAPLHAVAADKETVTVDGLIFEIDDSDAVLIGVEDTGITSITIPAEVNGCPVYNCDNSFFMECQNLLEINVEESVYHTLNSIDGVLFMNQNVTAYPRGRAGDYIIPEGTLKIVDNAFSYSDKLTSVTLPESLFTIEQEAFAYCTALEEIKGKIPNSSSLKIWECPSLKYLEFAESNPDVSFGMYLYIKHCDSLEKIIFPENLSINELTIGETPMLKKLTLSGNVYDVRVIQSDALEEVYVPGGCRRIIAENNANLKKIRVNGTFDCETIVKNCPALNSITLYGNRQKLTLTDCPELETVNLYGEEKYSDTLTIKTPFDQLTVYGAAKNGVKNDCALYNIPYEVLEPYTGDANDDGAFNLVDVIMLQKYLLKAGRLTCWKNCDYNGDGKVDVFDLVFMKRALLSGK